MRILGKLSLAFSNDVKASPVAVPGALVPAGQWSLIVDVNGDTITDRRPGPEDLLARRPVSYKYLGTLPAFTPDSDKTPENNAHARTAYEIRAARNRRLLEKAVFLASQINDGRRLLTYALNQGYAIVFDPEKLKELKAAGLCESSKKIISLSEGIDAAAVARFLKHELQHTEDIGGGLDYTIKDSVRTATTASRALEANARVSEAVLGAELLLGTPDGPERQFRSNKVMNSFLHQYAHMASAVVNAMSHAQSGHWQHFAAAIFPSYYDELPTLAYYDSSLIDEYQDTLDRSTTSGGIRSLVIGEDNVRSQTPVVVSFTYRSPILTSARSWHDSDLSELLTIKGAPYLALANNFSPTSDHSITLTPDALPALRKLIVQIDTRGLLQQCGNGLEIPLGNTDNQKRQPLRYSFRGAAAPAEPEFHPTKLPARIDGPPHSHGRSMNEIITHEFGEVYQARDSIASEIERMSAAVHDWLRSNKGASFTSLHIGHLINAGLRAPASALPGSYLQNLTRRLLQAGSRAFSDSDEFKAPNPIHGYEIKLIDHWQRAALEAPADIIDENEDRLRWQHKMGRIDQTTYNMIQAVQYRFIPS